MTVCVSETRGRALARPPILDYITRKLPPRASDAVALARKQSCSSVWCPVCYRREHLRRHFERLSLIPWDEARFLTLTLDREKVGEGADAYIWFREKKPLGRFFVSLARQGIKVNDWCGQIEFHKDGTPHFHLLVRTSKGPGGMIGNERLLKAWPWGIVWEEYFRTYKDYENTVGYFGKAGYFHKKKEHQTKLPDYFASEYFRGMKIIRFYAARLKGVVPQEVSRETLKESQSKAFDRVQECGKSTVVYSVSYDDHYNEYETFLERINIPYGQFMVMCPGFYKKGRGYIFFLDGDPINVEICVNNRFDLASERSRPDLPEADSSCAYSA